MLLLILIISSGRTRIIILFDVETPVVAFLNYILAFLPRIQSGVHLSYLWCYVTVWPVVGQCVSVIGNYLFLVIRHFFY